MRKASRSMIFIRHLKTKTMKGIGIETINQRHYYVRRGWGFPELERKLKGRIFEFLLDADDRLPSFDVDCFQRWEG